MPISFSLTSNLQVQNNLTVSSLASAILRVDSSGLISTTTLQSNLSLATGTLSLATALTSINSITAATGTALTLNGGSSGASISIDPVASGFIRATLVANGSFEINSSATSTQARLNINLLSPGVAATSEAVVSYQAYDAGSVNYRQIGAVGAYWVDAGATGYSAVFMHAVDYGGGGSNNDVRVSAGHGMLFFATDNVFPGANILKVYGTVDVVTGITNSGTYLGTAATPTVTVTSTSSTSQSQLAAVNSTNRALVLGAFGDTKTGTTFGASNNGLVYLMTATLSSNYPTALAIGTLGTTAPIIFGVNGTETGRFTSTLFSIAHTTASTSSTTGALVVSGGIGAAGSIFVGGSVFSIGGSFRASPSGSGTTYGRLGNDPLRDDVFFVGSNWTGGNFDDTAKPAWYWSFDSRLAADNAVLWRAAPASSPVSHLNVSSTGVTTLCASTATPAGGSTSARLVFGTTAGFGVYYGSGAPTVSAAQGSIYIRSDGSSSSTRLYVNTNGSTTWTNFTSAT